MRIKQRRNWAQIENLTNSTKLITRRREDQMNSVRKHSKPPILARVGDIDPITHGGGVLFFSPGRGMLLEYTEGTEYSDGPLLDVYRVLLLPDILQQFDLSSGDVDELCTAIDEDRNNWTQRALGPDLEARAECAINIANYIGWDEVDSNPLPMSETELQLRWYPDFFEEGPTCTPGCFKPQVIAPEMLQALLNISHDEYWKLLAAPFPLIPSEPLQNPDSPWWKKHGAEVVTKLVETMRRVCPEGYRFGVHEETFGFWKIKR